jgi:hypothetical protein
MSEREFRMEGAGDSGSGELPGQETNEGVGGGPASGQDDTSTSDSISLDDLAGPEGDPVDLDEMRAAQEEADALALEHVREELAELAEPEGKPEEVGDDNEEDNDEEQEDEEEEEGHGEEDGGDYDEFDDDYDDDDNEDDDGDGDGEVAD